MDMEEVLYNVFAWIKGQHSEGKDPLPADENPWRIASKMYQTLYSQVDFSQAMTPNRYCIIPARFKYRTDEDVFYCCLKGKPHTRVPATSLYSFIDKIRLDLGGDFQAVMDSATLDTILSNIFVELGMIHAPRGVEVDLPKMSYFCDERFFEILTWSSSGGGNPSPQQWDRHFGGTHAQRLKQFLCSRNIITRRAINAPDFNADSNRYAPINLLDHSKWATLYMPLYKEPLGVGVVVHLKTRRTMSYRVRTVSRFDVGITGIEKWLGKAISWAFVGAASDAGWTHAHQHVEVVLLPSRNVPPPTC